MANVQEIAQITAGLQVNLEKMGVVTELVDDAMDMMDDANDDLDEDVVLHLNPNYQEVNRILDEVEEKVKPNSNKGTALQNPAQQQQQQDGFDDMLNQLKM